MMLAMAGFSQDEKIVTLTVSGQGKTQDEAKSSALRNAIEQAFGTFISSNTQILNDELIRDEIVSLSNGNIQKYEELNMSSLPDGSFAVTLLASVSVSKLITFSESKGVTVEFKGGLFAVNIKQQILNEQAESKAIWDMLFMLNPIAHQSFDYTITTNNPVALNNENSLWGISLTVTATTNDNIAFLFDYLTKNLSAIALNKSEYTNYIKLNKPVFPIKIDTTTYYFRKKESQLAIRVFFSEFDFIITNFIVNDGFTKRAAGQFPAFKGRTMGEKLTGDGTIIKYFEPKDSDSEVNVYTPSGKLIGRWGCKWEYNKDRDRCFFCRYFSLKPGEITSVYILKDTKSLEEIEILMGYLIMPAYPFSKIGTWYQGGIVFYEDDNGGGLISALVDQPVPDGEEYNKGMKRDNIFNYDRNLETNIYKNNNLTSITLGAGKQNTKSIVKKYINKNTPAAICNNLILNSYKDWFLPSIQELELMNMNLSTQGIGGWIDYGFNWEGRNYISSSQCDLYSTNVYGKRSYSESAPWGINMRSVPETDSEKKSYEYKSKNGYQVFTYIGTNANREFRIRAIRAF